MYIVEDEAFSKDSGLCTAKALAAAVREIPDVSLVLCGEGSSDVYAQTTGVTLGALLDWNTVNAVSSIHLQGEVLLVERSLEQATEVLEVPLPAVVCVTSDINIPSFPTIREVMAAGKKPFSVNQAPTCVSQAEPAVVIVNEQAPERTVRRMEVFPDASEENMDRLFEQIRKNL